MRIVIREEQNELIIWYIVCFNLIVYICLKGLVEIMEGTKGKKANRHGHILKNKLEALFRENGYMVVPHGVYKKSGNLPDKVVVKNFPFQSIYEHRGKTDFLLMNETLWRRIRIDCRWQQSSGSADAKFPYMYLNAILGYKESEVIFIVDGGGSQPRARRWLRKVADNHWLVDEKHPKDIRVMTLAQFTDYFKKNLI